MASRCSWLGRQVVHHKTHDRETGGAAQVWRGSTEHGGVGARVSAGAPHTDVEARSCAGAAIPAAAAATHVTDANTCLTSICAVFMLARLATQLNRASHADTL